MTEIDSILARLDAGDPKAADELLPLVYQELRQLALHRMSSEPPGQTLQPTALVHEAYLRLVKSQSHDWNSRAHFFSAAAEAMRRILIEKARQKRTLKRGGQWTAKQLDDFPGPIVDDSIDYLAIHETLAQFEQLEPRKAELVKLRCFVGLTLPETAEVLGISLATANRDWAYARAWLQSALADENRTSESD